METLAQELIPDPDLVLVRLEPIIEPLYRAAEIGTECARSYGWRKNPQTKLIATCQFLGPSIARYHMRHHLAEHIHDVSDELDLDETLANNGICFGFRNFSIRILKAYRGGLPRATSIVRQDFYRQQLNLFHIATPVDPESIVELPINLAVLWVVDAAYNLVRLELACPKSEKAQRGQDGEFLAAAETHWMRTIPHPGEFSEAIAAPPDTNEPEIGVVDEVLDDVVSDESDG